MKEYAWELDKKKHKDVKPYAKAKELKKQARNLMIIIAIVIIINALATYTLLFFKDAIYFILPITFCYVMSIVLLLIYAGSIKRHLITGYAIVYWLDENGSLLHCVVENNQETRNLISESIEEYLYFKIAGLNGHSYYSRDSDPKGTTRTIIKLIDETTTSLVSIKISYPNFITTVSIKHVLQYKLFRNTANRDIFITHELINSVQEQTSAGARTSALTEKMLEYIAADMAQENQPQKNQMLSFVLNQLVEIDKANIKKYQLSRYLVSCSTDLANHAMAKTNKYFFQNDDMAKNVAEQIARNAFADDPDAKMVRVVVKKIPTDDSDYYSPTERAKEPLANFVIALPEKETPAPPVATEPEIKATPTETQPVAAA